VRLRRNANSMRLPAMLADRDRPGSMIAALATSEGVVIFHERAVSREISLKFMSAGASSI
jgi:hypothetical protein